MKVAFFLGALSGSGGSERVAMAIANELSKRSHDIYLIGLWGGPPFFETHEHIKVVSLYKKKKKFKLIYPDVVYRLRRTLKRNNIQCLIDVESILCLYSIPATLNSGIKHIVWEHFNFTVDLGVRIRRMARIAAGKYADKIVVLTERDKNLWMSNIKSRIAINVIPNPRPFQVKSSEISPLTDKVVLAVGRLTYQKGFDLLLQSWEKVMRRVTDWKLIIVGDGEDYEALNGIRVSLDIEPNVRFISSTKNITSYYQGASIFCLSSRFEGFPMVLLEAQSFGLPVVSFNCETGPSEIITHGQNGLLVEPGDTDTFASSIVGLIENQAMRYQMQKESLINVTKYDIATATAKWESIIN